MTNVVLLPVKDATKRETALDRDMDALIDVFLELHEVERMTGKTGLSARVRLAVSDVLSVADRLAGELP